MADTEAHAGRRPLVLVADDDPALRLLARESLAYAGYAVEEARTGLEVLSAFADSKPDAVLLDIVMPEMDGFAVCAALRMMPGGTSVPILMITGFDDLESINRAYEAGATDFVTKPINWLILGHRVSYMLRAQETSSAYRRSEGRNRALLHAIPDFILQVTPDGLVVDHKTAGEISQILVAREINNRSVASILPGDLADIFMRHVDQALRTNKLQRFDYPHDQNGKQHHYEFRIVVCGEQEALAVVQDVTTRKQVEDNLRDSMEKLRQAMQGTVQVISSTVECKDPYTAGHQRRVADLARTIATEMGLARDQIDGIRTAGVIHDLGKISVPAEILSKPGRLTEIEFNFIKAHPQTGYDILKDIEFPWPVADIVLQHHERMDGSGYPQGLKGSAILLEARILAVADVVEAMASHRPYRPMLGIDKALEEIERNRGITYDQEVADACARVIREKGFDFERH